MDDEPERIGVVEKVEGDALWRTLSASALAEHIVSQHHDYLRRELPALGTLATRVKAAHRPHHGELNEVEALVLDLRRDLDAHLAREEQIFADLLRETTGAAGSPRAVLASMIQEHAQVEGLLETLRQVTGDYEFPSGADEDYRDLYRRLERFERDMRLHTQKEEQRLFPLLLEESSEEPWTT